jgi:type II restriction/modification system DNA methylase subunit YeeA
MPKYNKVIFEAVVSLTQQILDIKQANNSAETKDLENQIDQLVYQLYELTEEEIAIIENSTK